MLRAVTYEHWLGPFKAAQVTAAPTAWINLWHRSFSTSSPYLPNLQRLVIRNVARGRRSYPAYIIDVPLSALALYQQRQQQGQQQQQLLELELPGLQASYALADCRRTATYPLPIPASSALYLSSVTSLQRLVLYFDNPAENLSHLAALTQLTYLMLECTHLLSSDPLPDLLPKLRSLHGLSLHVRIDLEAPHIDSLTSLNHLTHLELNCDGPTAPVPGLAVLGSRLRQLSWHCGSLHFIEQLQHLTGLESLVWAAEDAGVDLTVHGTAFRSLTRLTQLEVAVPSDWYSLDQWLWDSITGLVNLQALGLENYALLPEGPVLGEATAGVTALATLTALTRLCITFVDLSSPAIAVPVMVALTGLTRLRHLELRECRVGDAVVAVAAVHLQQLTHLDLMGCPDLSIEVVSGLNVLPALRELLLTQVPGDSAEMTAGRAGIKQAYPWLGRAIRLPGLDTLKSGL